MQAIGPVRQRDGQRRVAELAQRAAHQIGALLAVEHGFQQFDRNKGLHAAIPMRETLRHRIGHAFGAALRMRVWNIERITGQHAHEHIRKIAVDRIVVARHRMHDAIRRFQIGGDELDGAIHSARAEKAPRQRVVVGLEKLLIQQAGNAIGEIGADGLPQRPIPRTFSQCFPQPRIGGRDALVVQVDAFHQIAAQARHIVLLKARSRTPGDIRKPRVVVLETFADGLRCGAADIGHGGVAVRAMGPVTANILVQRHALLSAKHAALHAPR